MKLHAGSLGLITACSNRFRAQTGISAHESTWLGRREREVDLLGKGVSLPFSPFLFTEADRRRADCLALFFIARRMNSDLTLRDHNVQDGSTMHVVLALKGCACGCGLFPPQIEFEVGPLEASDCRALSARIQV